MYPQGTLRTDSIESTSKKSNRTLYILRFVEFIFISICLLLLLLNQYLNAVVDDYSPAYQIPDDDDVESTKFTSKIINSSTTPISEDTSRVFDPTNNPTTKIPSTTQSTSEQAPKILLPTTMTQSPEKQTSQMILPTTHPPSTKNPTTDITIMSHTTDIKDTGGSDMVGFFNNHSNTNNDSNLDTAEDKHKRRLVKKSELNDLKTKTEEKHLETDETTMKSVMESLSDHSKTAIKLRPKQNEDWRDLFVSNLSSIKISFTNKRDENVPYEKQTHHHTTTKLTNLLIMYPSCVTAMIILWMQMISHLTNDIMFKSTMIALTVICISLGTTVLAASVIESLTQQNSVTILISVSSAIFIILEVIDFILLFVQV